MGVGIRGSFEICKIFILVFLVLGCLLVLGFFCGIEKVG